MSILDGRQAVQERLDAIDAERAILTDILAGYDALAQPEQVRSVQPAPVSQPEPGDSPPVAAAPAPRRHRKETFVCSRCPMTFKTKGWRDRHQSKHEPIPDVTPRGGQRVRSIPPGFRMPIDNGAGGEVVPA